MISINRSQKLIGYFAIFVFLLWFIRIISRVTQASTYVADGRKCLQNNILYQPVEMYRTTIWNTLPTIVQKCVYRHVFDELLEMKSADGGYFTFMPGKVWAPDHQCDVIFLPNNNKTLDELTFSMHQPQCHINSASKTHRKTKGSKIIKYPLHVTSRKAGIGKTTKSIVDFIVQDIRRFKVDAVYIAARKDNVGLLQDFMSGGQMEWKSITVCQVQMSIMRPETARETKELRDVLLRIVEENKYLLTSVCRHPVLPDVLVFFMLNLDNGFCWTKYVAPQVRFEERVV